MPTMVFSNESRYWRGLCVNSLFAESSVPAPGNCEVCVRPVYVPPPGCGGTSLWTWSNLALEDPPSVGFGWVLTTDSCTGDGTPATPSSPGSTLGETLTTDCDCP